jgi:hypothetical protein
MIKTHRTSTQFSREVEFDPNSYPEEEFNVNIDTDDLPEFVHYILGDVSISHKAKEKFVKKFLLTYLTDPEFNRKVDGWTFMFIDGEYIGLFKNKSMAMNYIKNTRYEGRSPLFVPMYFTIYGEKVETAIISKERKIINRTIDGEEFTNLQYEYLMATCSLINDSEQITKNENYLIDTGASITHLPNTNYFNYETGKFNNYPYDELNNAIIDEGLRNDKLLLMNNLIEWQQPVDMEGSLSNKYKKVLCSIKSNTHFLLNDEIEITVKYLSRSHVIITPKRSQDILSFLNKIVEKSFERPKEVTRLLGLDIIMQIPSEIKQIYPKISTLILHSPNKINENIDFNSINNFKVYQLSAKSEFYSLKTSEIFIGGKLKSTRNISSLNNFTYFYLLKDYLAIIDTNGTYYYEKYENIRPVNLIILNNTLNLEIIKTKILSLPNLDGLIYKSAIHPFNLTIWIKNSNDLKYLGDIDNREISDIKEINVNNEYKILNKSKLSEWIISINFAI